MPVACAARPGFSDTSACTPEQMSPATLQALPGAVRPTGEALALDPLWIPEKPDQDQPGDEPADVCPVGDATGRCGRDTERGDAGKKLENEPETDEDERGKVKEDRNEAEKGDGADESAGIEDEIGPHDGRDGTRRTDHRNPRGWVQQRLGPGGCDAAEEIEDQVPEMPHRVLDVVAKDVEVPHVPDQVSEPSVQEHRGENREVDGKANSRRKIHPMCEFVRDRAVLEDEVLQCAGRSGQQEELIEKDENVERDQDGVDDREALPSAVVVTDRKHGLLASIRNIEVGETG